jgi:hypothetical protein
MAAIRAGSAGLPLSLPLHGIGRKQQRGGQADEPDHGQ